MMVKRSIVFISMESSMELSMAIEAHGGWLKGVFYVHGGFHGTVNGKRGTGHMVG
jgi:hypothetical protein